MFRSLDKEHSAFSLSSLQGYHISVWICFYEVYNENVFDLLDIANLKLPKKKTILKIGRDQNQDVYIKGKIFWTQAETITPLLNLK